MCVSMVYTQDHKHEYVTLYGGGCGGRRSWCRVQHGDGRAEEAVPAPVAPPEVGGQTWLGRQPPLTTQPALLRPLALDSHEGRGGE